MEQFVPGPQLHPQASLTHRMLRVVVYKDIIGCSALQSGPGCPSLFGMPAAKQQFAINDLIRTIESDRSVQYCMHLKIKANVACLTKQYALPNPGSSLPPSLPRPLSPFPPPLPSLSLPPSSSLPHSPSLPSSLPPSLPPSLSLSPPPSSPTNGLAVAGTRRQMDSLSPGLANKGFCRCRDSQTNAGQVACRTTVGTRRCRDSPVQT